MTGLLLWTMRPIAHVSGLERSARQRPDSTSATCRWRMVRLRDRFTTRRPITFRLRISGRNPSLPGVPDIVTGQRTDVRVH